MTKLIHRSVERFSFVFGFVAILILSGCAIIPPAVSITTFAIDGISYAVSGKSTTDHLISGIAEKDCALHRSLTEDTICKTIKEKAPAATVENTPSSTPSQAENVEQTMARLLQEYNAKI